MVLVYVPAGEFPMGTSEAEFSQTLELCAHDNGGTPCILADLQDETPQHIVYLDAFWIDRTEVTVAMFRLFAQATAYRTTAEQEGTGSVWLEEKQYLDYIPGADWEHPEGPGSVALADHPVVQVSWDDAGAYCRWAGGRLPTEAEWEKAARGPAALMYPWGNEFDGTRLNFCDTNCPSEWRDAQSNDGYKTTAPVGSYPRGASWCGALDLAGNVSEWVQDWYVGTYYTFAPARNPSGWDEGSYKVFRGGDWMSGRWDTRAACRSYAGPQGGRSTSQGFRCVVPAGK
jgi:formylglycine-generating enzyme required for sulfatase activity